MIDCLLMGSWVVAMIVTANLRRPRFRLWWAIGVGVSYPLLAWALGGVDSAIVVAVVNSIALLLILLRKRVVDSNVSYYRSLVDSFNGYAEILTQWHELPFCTEHDHVSLQNAILASRSMLVIMDKQFSTMSVATGEKAECHLRMVERLQKENRVHFVATPAQMSIAEFMVSYPVQNKHCLLISSDSKLRILARSAGASVFEGSVNMDALPN